MLFSGTIMPFGHNIPRRSSNNQQKYSPTFCTRGSQNSAETEAHGRMAAAEERAFSTRDFGKSGPDQLFRGTTGTARNTRDDNQPAQDLKDQVNSI